MLLFKDIFIYFWPPFSYTCTSFIFFFLKSTIFSLKKDLEGIDAGILKIIVLKVVLILYCKILLKFVYFLISVIKFHLMKYGHDSRWTAFKIRWIFLHAMKWRTKNLWNVLIKLELRICEMFLIDRDVLTIPHIFASLHQTAFWCNNCFEILCHYDNFKQWL